MASYVKLTDFAAKDSLTTGDPQKIIKGQEINDEFNAIQTSIATKADTNSPALLGNPTAPTQTFGNSSTRVATTAFVQAALQALHPVGSIYIAVISTNPATLFGFGTWVAFGTGRTLIGFDSGDALFNAAENTGGSKDAVVVEHTHSITDPGHTHAPPSGLNAPWVSNPFTGDGAFDGSTGTGPNERNPVSGNTQSNTTGISINNTGVSETNANLPPYITVYMWKRTA